MNSSGLSLTNTEGITDERRGDERRGVDGLEVSVWSDSFPDLIIHQSRDSSHFADGKFMATSILRTVDDSPKVRLPLTNTEGGKSRGAHGQEVSVSIEHFSDLKNIQGGDLLFSADQMSMKPSITHAEDSSPKACLSAFLTEGDIFERRGVDGLEVDGCGDRFLDLTIHQSQDSSLSEHSPSPKACLSLTDTEVDIGVNGLEVDICSDSFPEPIDIHSQDLSLTPVNMAMDVDDSPEEQHGKGRKKTGIRGFFKGTCKAVKRLFLPSRSTKVEPIVPSLQPDKPQSDVGLSVPVVSGLEQSSGSHLLERTPDACPVDEENAAKVCSMPEQTSYTDSDFNGKAHVLHTSDNMSASSVHIADEGVDQRNGVELLREQMLAVLDAFLSSDIRPIEMEDTSSEAVEMNTVIKSQQLSDSLLSNDKKSNRMTGNSPASIRLDMIDMKDKPIPLTGINPNEQHVKKKATGIRGFCERTWKATTQIFSRKINKMKRSPSYKKLFKPTKGDVQSYYKLGDILGQGGFGMVRLGTRISDGQEVAIKFMSKLEDKQTLLIPGHRKRLLTEVALLLKMSEAPLSPNVIRMYEWFDDPKHVIVIMEYPKPCKSLMEFLIRSNTLSEDTARVLMHQAVEAVIDCIDHGVFHNDIHPGNMLVNPKTLELKLIDFGCGQLLSPAGYKTKKYRGVPSYYPPEVLSKPRYHAIPTNVWCLGMVLYKMVNGWTCKPYLNSEEVNFVNTSLSEGYT